MRFFAIHVERYKKELDAFLRHTKSIRYNGKDVPRVALVSPTAGRHGRLLSSTRTLQVIRASATVTPVVASRRAHLTRAAVPATSCATQCTQRPRWQRRAARAKIEPICATAAAPAELHAGFRHKACRLRKLGSLGVMGISG